MEDVTIEKGYTANGREIELRWRFGTDKFFIWQDDGGGRTTETHGTNDNIRTLWTKLTTVAPANEATK
jgi:hypothetical protein